ncbi:hypothetical protein PISMIDRAFT_687330 [Pisolithus microcarpus 441]|uniref:Uncharacterized protein n=1 Tax=Pisolithus microcarpus 441 TaxID=765257 RepID=A0A0C9YFS3_9AGAM|nr:hypothetical protein PISMIDRAFT_687330 [Pisolithus microcarpus 441]
MIHDNTGLVPSPETGTNPGLLVAYTGMSDSEKYPLRPERANARTLQRTVDDVLET